MFNLKKRSIAVPVVVVVVLLAAAAVVVLHKPHSSAGAVASIAPQSITAGPAGMISGTAPNASGELWVLVNLNGSANVQLVSTSGTSSLTTYPVSNSATVIATNSDATLGIGLGTGTTGAVQFFSTNGMKPLGTVALPGPVTDLVGSSNGNTYYALVQIGGVDSVDVVNSQTRKIVSSIPMPSMTDSIAVSPDLSTIYALQGHGVVSLVGVASKHVTQSFAITTGARQLVLSPDGSKLYVLKGSSADDNVAVIDIATEATSFVLPAPAFCQAIEISPSGGLLYDLVGTPGYGNIQVFSTTK